MKTKTPKQKISVGDRVRVKHKNNLAVITYSGMIGTVIEISKGKLNYHVQLDGTDRETLFQRTEIEPITAYMRQWESYINELTRLGWNLESTDFSELKLVIAQLKKFVKRADDNHILRGGD